VSGIGFSAYTADEIRKLSVKAITNPTSFDLLGHPMNGGLYDQALGPIEQRDRHVVPQLAFSCVLMCATTS
jgi:DNA-directed RNA polymerase I subunit RPA1